MHWKPSISLVCQPVRCFSTTPQQQSSQKSSMHMSDERIAEKKGPEAAPHRLDKDVAKQRDKLLDDDDDSEYSSFFENDFKDQIKLDEVKPPLLERVKTGSINAGKALLDLIRHPSKLPGVWQKLKISIKESAHHHYHGARMFKADVSTSIRLYRRSRHTPLTRRERQLVGSTIYDMIRIVPVAIIIIIPFFELLLPVLLKLFPNMMPKQFQDMQKRYLMIRQEYLKRRQMAKGIHELVEKRIAEESAEEVERLKELLKKARAGKRIRNRDIIRLSNLFKENFQLQNFSKAQLKELCQFLNLPGYGNRADLRNRLIAWVTRIRMDDKEILEEGIGRMSKAELRAACRERGMIGIGMTAAGYRRNLKQWIALSLNDDVPISLLILSRTFKIHERGVLEEKVKPEEDIVDSILPDEAPTEEAKEQDSETTSEQSAETPSKKESTAEAAPKGGDDADSTTPKTGKKERTKEEEEEEEEKTLSAEEKRELEYHHRQQREESLQKSATRIRKLMLKECSHSTLSGILDAIAAAQESKPELFKKGFSDQLSPEDLAELEAATAESETSEEKAADAVTARLCQINEEINKTVDVLPIVDTEGADEDLTSTEADAVNARQHKQIREIVTKFHSDDEAVIVFLNIAKHIAKLREERRTPQEQDSGNDAAKQENKDKKSRDQ